MNSAEAHNAIKVTIAGEEMILRSEKAIHLPEHDMLIISDLHFGKVEHFRKNGIAIPPAAARKGIDKLRQLMHTVGARRIVFLGDLFHSNYNNAWPAFKEMLKGFPDFTFELVIGNHDILDETLYEDLILIYKIEINKLILTHEPMDVILEGKYNLCGHIHPGVRLKGKGHQSVRIPCFYFGVNMGIMPAFGTFTGTHVIKPMMGDKVFVVDEDMVLEV